MNIEQAIAQLEKLVEARVKATKGPWVAIDNLHGTGGKIESVFECRHLVEVMERHAGIERDERRANGDFIALAGSIDFPAILALDFPAILAAMKEQVRKLEAVVGELIAVMNMQEKRQSDEFHVNAENIWPLWKQAKNAALAALRKEGE